MKRVAMGLASMALAVTVGFAGSIPAYAAKVDCDAVMQEVNSGKKNKEIATDLKISTSSVSRCKKKAAAAAKAEGTAGNTAASPAASPAAASSPAESTKKP